jgi:hypothetical protein
MTTLHRISALALTLLLTIQLYSQNTAAAAAGVAAGAALASGAGQSATTPSNAGSSNAPIEMNIMVYGGLKQISAGMATKIADALTAPSKGTSCESSKAVLLEDTTSSSLIYLFETWSVYQQAVQKTLNDLLAQETKSATDIADLIKGTAKAISDFDQKQPAQVPENPQNCTPTLQKKGACPPAPSGTREANAAPGAAASTAASTGGGGSTSSTPMGLTYLGDIGAQITALKSGVSYTAASIQPATQALSTALSKDLTAKCVRLYTSTSTIGLAPTETLNSVLEIQKANSNIQATLNTPTDLPTLTTTAEKADPSLQRLITLNTQRIKALSSQISSTAAVASQLVTSFQTWQAGSDGNGSIILTDVLRGAALKKAIGDGIPALQFNIDAAGGNTRTNNYFLLNLFYTPKPSFNGGVVVTYELRDPQNQFLVGDTLKVLYDYSKWKPNCFAMDSSTEVNSTSLGDGRGTQGHRYRKDVLCERK